MKPICMVKLILVQGLNRYGTMKSFNCKYFLRGGGLFYVNSAIKTGNERITIEAVNRQKELVGSCSLNLHKFTD